MIFCSCLFIVLYFDFSRLLLHESSYQTNLTNKIEIETQTDWFQNIIILVISPKKYVFFTFKTQFVVLYDSLRPVKQHSFLLFRQKIFKDLFCPFFFVFVSTIFWLIGYEDHIRYFGQKVLLVNKSNSIVVITQRLKVLFTQNGQCLILNWPAVNFINIFARIFTYTRTYTRTYIRT